MARPLLNVAARSELGKGPARRLRATGQVPAVLYGKDDKAQHLSFEPRELIAIFAGELGRNTPIDVTLAGGEPRLCMAKQPQLHPVRRSLVHCDFWEISPDRLVTVPVPFKTVGKAPQQAAGATIRIVRRTVNVRCLPANIPAAITFDLTKLASDAHRVMISEIAAPDGVQTIYKDDYNVIQVKAAKEEVAEDGEAGEDVAAVVAEA